MNKCNYKDVGGVHVEEYRDRWQCQWVFTPIPHYKCGLSSLAMVSGFFWHFQGEEHSCSSQLSEDNKVGHPSGDQVQRRQDPVRERTRR